MKATIQPSPILLELSPEEAKVILQATGNTQGIRGNELVFHAFSNAEKAKAANDVFVKVYSALYAAGVR